MSEKTEHETAQEALSPYLEGELEPERKKALEEHLERCPDCRRRLELMRHSLELLRQLPAPEAPPEFAPRLKALARRRGLIGKRRRPEAARWLISFEVTLLLFLVTTGSVLALIYFMELAPTLAEKPPSVSLVLPDRGRLNWLAQTVRDCRGLIQSGHHLLAPHRPPPESKSMALVMEPAGVKCLREKLAAAGLEKALQGDSPPGAIGLLVIPVFFADQSSPLRAPEEPASDPDLHRSR